MKKLVSILIVLYFIVNSSVIFAQSLVNKVKSATESYLPNTVIIKLKPTYRSAAKGNSVDLELLNTVFTDIKATSVEKKFPSIKPPAKQVNVLGQSLVDLSLIYEIAYKDNATIDKIISDLMATGTLDYAVPHYLPQLLYMPNDAKISSQYYLTNIKAFEAWDVSKGDTNTVIGVSDTGTDIDHPDLIGNIKYNYADPIDGKDNDNDGYIDNFRGWDLADKDNNPSCDYKAPGGLHGSFVGGFLGASTDNLTGIASVGFKCKFLPLKINDSLGKLVASYESIVYAAEHGCTILNCSWGSPYYSSFGQDVINYATINHDVMIVAAAGNANNEDAYYPASYRNVLNVTATDDKDQKWANSSNGITVDVSAPGASVYGTWDGGGYLTSSGTSFATPIVAGLAGLIRSYRPHLNGLQVAHQIKVTTDNIDTIPVNKAYANKLGTGRINAYKALTDTMSPSIEMLSTNFPSLSKKKGASDTITLISNFINYLAPTKHLKITLQILSPNLKLIDSVFTADKKNTLEVFSNNLKPFKLIPIKSVPPGTRMSFKLIYSDSAYSAFEYFNIMLNVDFINLDTNKVAVTISSKGIIGYNDQNVHQGIGFKYKSASILSWGGLVLGNSTTSISDAAYGVSGSDDDFYIISPTVRLKKPVKGDVQLHAEFTDSLAGYYKLNVYVKQNSYAWANDKFIINEYTIINKDSLSIKDLYIGLYLDWDIDNSNSNRASYDTSVRVGYAYSLESNTYAAAKLLTKQTEHYYAFNNDGAENSLSVYDGLTSYDKFVSMSNNRPEAGLDVKGGDISQMISAGSVTIKSGDSVVIAFALIAGDNRLDIVTSAKDAVKRYYPDSLLVVQKNEISNSSLRVYPNPASTEIKYRIVSNNNTNSTLYICDAFGRIVYKSDQSSFIDGQTYSVSTNIFENGVYYFVLETPENKEIQRFIVVK